METMTLGSKTYKVVKQSANGADLLGSRGASYALVRNVNNPELFALIPRNRHKPSTSWFRKTESGFVESK